MDRLDGENSQDERKSRKGGKIEKRGKRDLNAKVMAR